MILALVLVVVPAAPPFVEPFPPSVLVPADGDDVPTNALIVVGQVDGPVLVDVAAGADVEVDRQLFNHPRGTLFRLLPQGQLAPATAHAVFDETTGGDSVGGFTTG